MLPEVRLNSVLLDYLFQNDLGELLRLAETLASQKKPSYTCLCLCECAEPENL